MNTIQAPTAAAPAPVVASLNQALATVLHRSSFAMNSELIDDRRRNENAEIIETFDLDDTHPVTSGIGMVVRRAVMCEPGHCQFGHVVEHIESTFYVAAVEFPA